MSKRSLYFLVSFNLAGFSEMSSSTQPPHVVDFTIRVIEFRSNSLKALKNNEEKFITNFINPQIALPITSTDISF
jgi:hypothetical protein